MFHGLRIPSGRWRSSFPEVSRERDSEKRRQISLRRLRRGNNHSCRCIFLFLFFFFSYRGGDACDEYKKWRRRGRRRKRRALEFPSSFFLSFFLSLSVGRCFESVIYDEKGEEEEEEEQKNSKKSHKKASLFAPESARAHVEIKSQNGHIWSRSRNNTKTMGGARRSHSNTSSSRAMTPSLSKREC